MAYIDKYGVEFSDDRKILITCPSDFQGEYTIPDGVTSIGEYAFEDCIGLTSITIPDSVTSIGRNAFWMCCGLTSITIPNSVTSIEESAFSDCSGLTSITIPDSVTSIGDGAFSGCSSLTSITIPDNVTSIEGSAFSGCHGLTSIIIPDSVTYIGYWAFSGCSGLTSITIPNSVTNIGSYAFEDCSGLTSTTIPDSVTSIGRCAFSGCSGLTSIIVSGGNKKYDSRNNCNAIIETAKNCIIVGCKTTVIPKSVTSIGDSAFYGCSGLTSITIPNSVTRIGDDAFKGCSGLTSITIPDSVTSIGRCAFSGCSGLTSITIGSGVTNLGSYAFARCSSLTSITIPNSVTSIGDSAFKGCSGLTSITIPDGVTSIGEWVFYGCSGLTSITIPDSVTSIGRYAFDGCSSLKEICIPKGQKARFLQMEGLKEYADRIVERDNEELTILTNLAKAYELGVGVQKNIVQAVLYYTQAADKGSAEAAYTLAGWYAKGEILPQDTDKALQLYNQAAKSGYKDAKRQAENLQKHIEQEKQRQEELLRRQKEEQETVRLAGQERLRQAEERQTKNIAKYIFFDTETTGVPRNYQAPVTDSYNWPRLVQLAWLLTDEKGNVLKRKTAIIRPNGFTIPADASAVHGITTQRALQEGLPLVDVLVEFIADLGLAQCIVGHNIEFDQHIVGAELYRLGRSYDKVMNTPAVCTMKKSIDFCAIPSTSRYYGGYKFPKLEELHRKLFGRTFSDAHDALADITATKDCYFELRRRGII